MGGWTVLAAAAAMPNDYKSSGRRFKFRPWS